MPNEAILQCERVTRVYRNPAGEENVVLRDLDFQLQQGEFVVLIGSSGCGKSTLLNLMAGFDKPTSGRITLRGAEVQRPGPDKAMVFQDYALLPWLDASGNVEIGLKLQGIERDKRKTIAREFLALVGLEHAVNRPVYQLSGGMQQRVSIARALALKPAVLFMDEPFGALDALQRAAMHAELTRIWRETRATIVFVTHSLDEAVFLADRVEAMSVAAKGIAGELAIELPRPRDPLSHEFADIKRKLLNMLQMGSDNRPLAALTG